MGTFAHAETGYFWTCSLSISGADVFAKCHNLKQPMFHFATCQKCKNMFLGAANVAFATFQKCKNKFLGAANVAFATFQKCNNKFLGAANVAFATFQKCRNMFFGEATIAI